MNRSVTLLMNSNATLSMRKFVKTPSLHMVVVREDMELLPHLLVDKSQDKSVGMFQDNNVEMFQDRFLDNSAGMYLDRSVTVFLKKSATVFLLKNVTLFKLRSVIMCQEKWQEKNAKMSQHKPAGL